MGNDLQATVVPLLRSGLLESLGACSVGPDPGPWSWSQISFLNGVWCLRCQPYLFREGLEEFHSACSILFTLIPFKWEQCTEHTRRERLWHNQQHPSRVPTSPASIPQVCPHLCAHAATSAALPQGNRSPPCSRITMRKRGGFGERALDDFNSKNR